MKVISELEAKVAVLTEELAEYKTVHERLNISRSEQQNELLRNKFYRYETVIEQNGMRKLSGYSRKIDRDTKK